MLNFNRLKKCLTYMEQLNVFVQTLQLCVSTGRLASFRNLKSWSHSRPPRPFKSSLTFSSLSWSVFVCSFKDSESAFEYFMSLMPQTFFFLVKNVCRINTTFQKFLLSRHESLLRCSQCKMARYCNTTCQVQCVCMCVLIFWGQKSSSHNVNHYILKCTLCLWLVAVVIMAMMDVSVYISVFISSSCRNKHGQAIRESVNVCRASYPDFPLTQSV